MKGSRVLKSALALLLGGMAFSTAFAQQHVSEKGERELDEETAVAVRNLLSRVSSLSVDEAIRRIQLETAMAPLIRDIQQEYAARLAGISIEQLPDFHVLVRLNGEGAVAPRQWATAAGSVRVEFSSGHPFTSEEFSKRLEDIRREVQAAIPGFVGLTGHVGDNEAEVRIRGDARDARKYQDILARLQRAYGVKLRFKTSVVPEKNAARAFGYAASARLQGAHGEALPPQEATLGQALDPEMPHPNHNRHSLVISDAYLAAHFRG